jgi:hypothetical protein
MTLERLLGLAEVFKADAAAKCDYTTDPAFNEVRDLWKIKYTSLGGDIKSADTKDPTAFLNTLLGENVNGISLVRLFPLADWSIAKPAPPAKKETAASRRSSSGKYHSTLIGGE